MRNRTYSEIDTLRNKFKDDKGKLKALDEINLYIEDMEKMYQKASWHWKKNSYIEIIIWQLKT